MEVSQTFLNATKGDCDHKMPPSQATLHLIAHITKITTHKRKTITVKQLARPPDKSVYWKTIFVISHP